MKRMTWLAMAVLILLGASVATAQSLGDYARAARKAKLQAASTGHHYDNDNLPKKQHVSVVGEESNGETDNPLATTAAAETDAAKAAKDPKAEAADPTKAPPKDSDTEATDTTKTTPKDPNAEAADPTKASPKDANPESTDAAKPTPKDPKPEATNRQKSSEDLEKEIDDQKQKVDALNHELDLAQREYRLRASAMYSDAGNRLRNQGAWDKEDAQYQQDMADKQKAIEAAKEQLDAVREEAQKAGVEEKEKEKDDE